MIKICKEKGNCSKFGLTRLLICFAKYKLKIDLRAFLFVFRSKKYEIWTYVFFLSNFTLE